MAVIWLFVVIILLCLLLADSASKALNLDRVRECVDKAEASEGKRLKRKHDDDVFILDFGDPAIEVFNILAPHDLKRLEYLAVCVQKEDSSLYEDKKFIKNGHLELAGSNVTYITGILQALLPDVVKKIDLALKDAIKEARWPTQRDQLGIRSAQYVTFTHGTKMKTRSEVAEERRKREEEANVFSIGPRPPPKPEEDDPRADEFVRDYMQRDEHSVYTLNLLVTSRNKFQGGEVLVRKHPSRQGSGSSRSDSYDDEDGYDEEEEEEEEEGGGGREEGKDDSPSRAAVKPQDKHRDVPAKRKVATFDMLTTTIARYTPEKGGGVLILANHEHGLHALARGRRDSLVIEFWPYADAPPGAKKPSIKEARPLPRRDPEL